MPCHLPDTRQCVVAAMLLRALPRAAARASTPSLFSCTRYAPSISRSIPSAARLASTIFQASEQPQQPIQAQQTRSAHAISNPTLASIEKRWEGMPPQEQAELWMQLRDRMKVDWHDLTLQEKKAGTAIQYTFLLTESSTTSSSFAIVKVITMSRKANECALQHGGLHLGLMDLVPRVRLENGLGSGCTLLLVSESHLYCSWSSTPSHGHRRGR